MTAQSGARALSDVAQPVTVLTGEELASRTAPTLGETLASQPGVSSTYFGPGASRPVIRGLGGDRIRVLEHGVGAGDASSTSPDHAVSIEPVAAETIEVVRGPATLLYGSSAVGGVVNVLDGRIPDRGPRPHARRHARPPRGLGQRGVERRRVAQGRRGSDRVPRRLRPAQDRGPEDPWFRRVRSAARVRGGRGRGRGARGGFRRAPEQRHRLDQRHAWARRTSAARASSEPRGRGSTRSTAFPAAIRTRRLRTRGRRRRSRRPCASTSSSAASTCAASARSRSARSAASSCASGSPTTSTRSSKATRSARCS